MNSKRQIMKYLIFLILTFSAGLIYGQEKAPIYDQVRYIDKYDIDSQSEGKIFIPSPFARPDLKTSDIDWSDKEITGVKYLYSKNNNNPEFAQNELSDKRYSNLISAYPVLENLQGVQWETLVQGGCPDNNCAKNLYHGFIIEYKIKSKPAPDPFLGQHNLENQRFNIVASRENVIEGKEGTKMLIPKNAFVFENGNFVTGLVTVTLKEALTPENIVLGNLATLTDNNEVLQSKGMIEVRASQNNSQLELASGVSITVSIPSGYEDGYSYYQGVGNDADLRWKNPVAIDRFDNNIEMNPENQGVWGQAGFWVERPVVEYKKESGQINKMTINMKDKRIVFDKSTFTKQLGRRSGLTRRQSRVVNNWFNTDNVVEEEIFVGTGRNAFRSDWERIEGGKCGKDGRMIGINIGAQDPEIANVFKMENLGWANIDQLASMSNTEKIRFNVAQEQIDSLENFSISLIVPKRNIYLPGYQKQDGYYSFTHGDYEDKVKMPVGEKAWVIAMGEKKGENYFQMMPVNLGENEIEYLTMQKTNKKEALAVIKQTL